jgi:predicted NUDIX family NTP pyrophosphohydrolase
MDARQEARHGVGLEAHGVTIREPLAQTGTGKRTGDYHPPMGERTSAGILLYRRTATDGGIEVLLAHPGGPYFAKRDLGDWTIPKGEPDGRHEPLDAVARREFEEETGMSIDAAGPAIELGSIVQKGGKVVHAWAVEGDLDPAGARSNEIEIEWPPRSGRRKRFPEIDRVEWFGPIEARRRIKPTQAPLIDRLEEVLAR